MSLFGYIVHANLALAITILLILFCRFLTNRVGLRVCHRAQVKALRAALLLSLIVPAMGYFLRSNKDALPTWVNLEALPGTILDHFHHLNLYIEAASLTFVAAVVFFCLFQIYITLRDYSHLIKLTHNSKLERCQPHVEIRSASEGTTPCAFRLARKTIVIIPRNLSKTVRRAALLHEFSHARLGDLNWNWLVAFLGIIYCWNPFYHLFRHELRSAGELACDQHVMSSSKINPNSYLQSLLKLATSRPEIECHGSLNATFFISDKFSCRLLERRIMEGCEPFVTRRSDIPKWVIAICLLFNVGIASVQISAPGWSINSLSISTETNRKRMKQTLWYSRDSSG